VPAHAGRAFLHARCEGALDLPFVAAHANTVAGGPAVLKPGNTGTHFLVSSRAIDPHRWAGRSGEGEVRLSDVQAAEEGCTSGCALVWAESRLNWDM
jgi:hypothetical protein